MLPEKITLPAALLNGAFVTANDGPTMVTVAPPLPKVFLNGAVLPSAESFLELVNIGILREPMTFCLTVFWLSDGRQVFVCTEIAENHGPSVTNAWPWLANHVLKIAGDVPREKAVFVEHYFSGSYGGHSSTKETYDLVFLKWDADMVTGQGWQRLAQ